LKMDSGSSAPQDAYRVEIPQSAPQQQQQQQQQSTAPQEECSILSPTLADILSDDRILRFYQCVKDIKTQRAPKQTAAMFFALCHALGDTVSFLKVPNMSKIMFRQEQQIFAVNVAGTQHDAVQLFQNNELPMDPLKMVSGASSSTVATAGLMHDVDSSHSSNIFSASATDNSPQHLLQAALASVTPVPEPAAPPPPPTTSKRRGNQDGKDGPKRAKKASPRDKEYAVRRKLDKAHK
jgi:hypothetical protein